MLRDVLNEMRDETLVAVAADGEDWPSGLLSRTLIPDKWMGLVETRDGRRRFVPAGDDPRPDDDDRLTLVRNRPLVAPLKVRGCKGAEGNLIHGGCEVLLRCGPNEHDLAAFRKRVVADERRLTSARLAERFARDGGREALEQFIRERSAEQLVHGSAKDELLEALRARLKKFCFEAGVTIERITGVEFSSDTFAEQEALKREAAQRMERIKAREMVESAALKATNRRLDDLKSVLEKLKLVAAGDEASQWHELLPALSPTERGRLLENLWRITPNRRAAEAIVVVAGNECIWFEPTDPERVLRRLTLDDSLGGLRSVDYAETERLLLVGASTGVWTVPANGEGQPRAYPTPDSGLQPTGFNAATIVGHGLYATHSRLGAWRWSLDGPADARALLRPTDGRPRTVRSVTPTGDGRVLFAADQTLYVYEPAAAALSTFAQAADTIHAVAVLEGSVYVGTQDGTLLRAELARPGEWRVVQRTRDAIESVTARRWNDLVELVIPAADEGIQSVYGDEGVVVHLLDGGVDIRRAWASDDLVVGLSDHRDRLLVMNANLPERTARELPVARMIGHSIQDACIVLGPETATAASESAPPTVS